MKKRGGELKGVLMAEAEAVIDELLRWHEETEAPNFSQIEAKVLALRERLSQRMAVEVAKGQATSRPVPGPVCQGCGQEMAAKGLHRKTIVSWVGEVELERSYYYCARCRRGLFPPG